MGNLGETSLLQRIKLMKGENSVSQFINLSSVIAPSIVFGRDGEMISTWRANGIAFETVNDAEINTAVEQMNTLYRVIARSDVAVQIHRIRRPLQDQLTESKELGFARILSMKYNQKIGNEDLMATELYISLILKNRRKIKGVKRSEAAIREAIEERVEEFTKLAEAFERSLSKFGLTKLGEYKKHNVEFSEQLEFYNFLLTGEMQPIRIPACPLYEALVPAQVFIGADTIEIQSIKGTKYAQCIELKDYVQSTYSGILDGLLYPDIVSIDPYVFIETQTYCFMSKVEGTKFLQLQQKQLKSSEDAAGSQIRAMELAIDGVADGEFSVGEYSYTIMVFADSKELVRKNTQDAAKKLQDEGFLPVLSTIALSAAYFSQLPSAFAFRPRIARITSTNFAHLAPLHNFDCGKREKNPWGEALALLKTPSNQPYYFNFHSSPRNENSLGKNYLGNTIIIGSSGAGKTVLQCFLMAMAQKYRNDGSPMTTIFLDKDRGAEIAIRAMGGGYLSVPNGEPTGFNPFALDPTEENVQFLIQFVQLLVEMDGFKLQTYETDDIAFAVTTVMKMPKEMRRLALVAQNLPNGVTREEQKTSVKKRLSRWIEDGDLAWAFDNDTDELDLTKFPIFGIDGTDFLDNNAVRAPISDYLIYRMNMMIDGRRFMFIMDEFWKWLSDKEFGKYAFDKIKVIRKQRGLGIFATQSPSDVLCSEFSKNIVENTSTQIFLPNPKADADDYINGFKVTEAEYKIIKSLREDSRRMLIKQGHNSVVCQLDLSWAKDELFILSGSTDNIAIMDECREKYGEAPEQWVAPFIRQARANVRRSKETA